MAIKPLVLLLLFGTSCLIQSCNGSDVKSDTTANSSQDQIDNRFINETAPESSLPCFAGACYRKAVSSLDSWLGIEGQVILPTILYDSTRINPLKPGQFLDNFSIYLGDTSDGQETDIGMTWEVIKDNAGNVSPDRRAFRPFLRRTAHQSGQAATYLNAPAESRYYWYPGDTISIGILVVDAGKLKFTVAGNGKKYEQVFDAAGCQYSIKAQYKRVNAIDQVSNEGKPTQPTKAKALNAKWLYVNLYRNVLSSTIKVPMHPKRYTDMRCPSVTNVSVQKIPENASGEIVTIIGTSN
jgi:hypothetical protein